MRCCMCLREINCHREETLIGEVVMHQNCEQCWDNRYGAEVARLAVLADRWQREGRVDFE